MIAALCLTFFAACVVLLYLSTLYNTTYWRRRGIRSPPTKHFFWNHIPETSRYDYPWAYQLRDWTRQYGKVYGFLQGWIKVLVISDPEMLHEMNVKKFEHFHGRMNRILFGDPDTEPDIHIFTAQGTRWKRLRTIAAPSFSTGNLKKILPTVDDCCRAVVTHLDAAYVAGQPFNIHPYFQELTMDIICRIAMGQQGSRMFKNPYVGIIKQLFSQYGRNKYEMFCNVAPFLQKPVHEAFKLFGAKELPCDGFMNALIHEVKTRRAARSTGKTRTTTDFIDIFLDAEDENISDVKEFSGILKVEKKLTLTETASQLFVFLLAGFDTTANTLGFTFFQLVKHPEIQEALYDEISGVCPDPDEALTYEQISSLRYADAVMKEVLRTYPVATFANARTCMQDTTLCGVPVYKGERVAADVLTLHFDPETWGDNVEDFVPERFFDLTQSQKKAFSAFGSGPRQCIGMRLAHIADRAAVVRVLQKYRVVACDATEDHVHPVGSVGITPQSVTVKLEKRV